MFCHRRYSIRMAIEGPNLDKIPCMDEQIAKEYCTVKVVYTYKLLSCKTRNFILKSETFEKWRTFPSLCMKL